MIGWPLATKSAGRLKGEVVLRPWRLGLADSESPTNVRDTLGLLSRISGWMFCLILPGKLVAVADLDFMGNRPRVDDLALTLYFGAMRRATTVAAEAKPVARGAARKHRSLSPSADASSHQTRPAMPWVCGSLYASLASPAMTSNRTASAREHLWSAA